LLLGTTILPGCAAVEFNWVTTIFPGLLPIYS
jgi:hypothetical protein